MINKFECLKCGACCKNFGSNGSFSGLPIFEWEKQEFEKFAKEKAIYLNINPSNIIYDKKSKTYVNISYFMKNQPCPFLKDNKCSIYNHRPIVCRSFPLARNPLIDNEPLSRSCFMHCPNFNSESFLKENLGIDENNSFMIEENKLIKEYQKFFGENILIYEAIHTRLSKYIKETINKLEEEQITSFENVSLDEKDKFDTIPFFEFLVKINYLDEIKKKEIIDNLLNEEKAKEKLFLK